MSSSAPTSDYLLLFRGTGWDREIPPDQLKQLLDRWTQWHDEIVAQGKMLSSRPLQPAGKIVSGAGGRAVSDGPFAESKETIAGYFMVRVSGEDEAVTIARGCPMLAHGMTVEVRPAADRCSVWQRADQMRAHSAA
jgi:hypothetical protein